MANWHNTPDGPKKCTASIRECKYSTGDSNGGHFANQNEAQQSFEAVMNAEHGVTATVTKGIADAEISERKAQEEKAISLSSKWTKEAFAHDSHAERMAAMEAAGIIDGSTQDYLYRLKNHDWDDAVTELRKRGNEAEDPAVADVFYRAAEEVYDTNIGSYQD